MTTALLPGGVRARRGGRLAVTLLVLAGLAAGWWAVHRAMPAWYARLWYPLEHESAIRQNAVRHELDPALVAAVINTESGFVPDSRSAAGAVGLMQVLPETARFIAGRPGRPSPSPERIGEPEVNIAYGTWYLRYLIDRHGSVDVALAAYNAGEGVVRGWDARARAAGRAFRVPEDVPFPETRTFVRRVRDTAPIYRRAYGDELGPAVPGLARVAADRPAPALTP